MMWFLFSRWDACTSRAPWGSHTGCSKSCRDPCEVDKNTRPHQLGWSRNLDLYPSVLCLSMRMSKYLVVFHFDSRSSYGWMLLGLCSRSLWLCCFASTHLLFTVLRFWYHCHANWYEIIGCFHVHGFIWNRAVSSETEDLLLNYAIHTWSILEDCENHKKLTS